VPGRASTSAWFSARRPVASGARCHETAEEYGSPGDLVLGANVAGFLQVAEAVHSLGLV
jgi:hypothetical protein